MGNFYSGNEFSAASNDTTTDVSIYGYGVNIPNYDPMAVDLWISVDAAKSETFWISTSKENVRRKVMSIIMANATPDMMLDIIYASYQEGVKLGTEDAQKEIRLALGLKE